MMNNQLYHHGILGQKWGKRNGPPYPLDSESHSRSEKQIGWRKSLNKKNENLYDRNKTKSSEDKKKKYIKIGLAIAGTALIAYGGFKLYQNKGLIKNYSNLGKKNIDFIRNSGKFDHLSYNTNIFSGSNKIVGKIGKSSQELDLKLISKINYKNTGTVEGSINCFHTSTTYILNSLFGYDFTAKGFNGIDESSGIKMEGRPGNLLFSIFNNINEISINKSSFSQGLKDIPNGTTGIVGLFNNNLSGHMLNYEKDYNGVVTLIDCQSDRIINVDNIKVSNALDKAFRSNFIVYDFSNSSLKDNIDDILNKIVN